MVADRVNDGDARALGTVYAIAQRRDGFLWIGADTGLYRFDGSRFLAWDSMSDSALPRTATWISGDKTGAYKYLPQSVNTFIGRSAMMSMMRDAGFAQVEQHAMTFGVCVCYRGVKA